MIRLANGNDIYSIMKIKDDAVLLMEQDNNDQWDKNYPTKESFVNYIIENELYVYQIDSKIVAMIVITDKEDTWYKDVAWSIKDNYYVVHRLAVSSEYAGKGIGKKMLWFAIELAKKNKIDIIKIDTYSKNIRTPRLFTSLGFKYIGDAYFNNKIKPYYCYEYVIDKIKS